MTDRRTKVRVRIGTSEVEGEFATNYDALNFLKEWKQLLEFMPQRPPDPRDPETLDGSKPLPKKPSPLGGAS